MPFHDPHDKIADGKLDPRIVKWLSTPAADNPWDDLDQLRQHLGTIAAHPPARSTLEKLLELVDARALSVVDNLLPRLFHIRLPISPQTRRTVQAMQDVLELQVRLHRLTTEAAAEILPAHGRILKLLHCHLFVSSLISAPASPGIWQQLHATAQALRQNKVAREAAGGDSDLEDRYVRTLLLGCAQASFFTAHELSCIERYTGRHSDLVHISEAPIADGSRSVFWLDPTHDMAPIALTRRPAPEGTATLQFSCDALLATIARQREQLRQGASAEAVGFPSELPARLARALLHRLAAAWGGLRKRRFPRRRQSYRARLCVGFEQVWGLLQGKTPEIIEASEWMVTNESPDGYATMHVTGKARKVQIGDLVSLRADDSPHWQICVVRWALSQNPEHLELGLQVLAPRASAAMLALPGQNSSAQHPALLLPAVPPLREKEAMVTTAGLLLDRPGKLILLVEAGKIEIRELRVNSVQEQSVSIDVFAVDPDPSL